MDDWTDGRMDRGHKKSPEMIFVFKIISNLQKIQNNQKYKLANSIDVGHSYFWKNKNRLVHLKNKSWLVHTVVVFYAIFGVFCFLFFLFFCKSTSYVLHRIDRISWKISNSTYCSVEKKKNSYMYSHPLYINFITMACCRFKSFIFVILLDHAFSISN